MYSDIFSGVIFTRGSVYNCRIVFVSRAKTSRVRHAPKTYYPRQGNNYKLLLFEFHAIRRPKYIRNTF